MNTKQMMLIGAAAVVGFMVVDYMSRKKQKNKGAAPPLGLVPGYPNQYVIQPDGTTMDYFKDSQLW